MDESQFHYAKWKEQDITDYLLYDSIYVMLWNRHRFFVDTENRAVFTWGWRFTMKGLEGFGGWRNCSSSWLITGTWWPVCQNSKNCALKWVNFTLCMANLNKSGFKMKQKKSAMWTCRKRKWRRNSGGGVETGQSWAVSSPPCGWGCILADCHVPWGARLRGKQAPPLTRS